MQDCLKKSAQSATNYIIHIITIYIITKSCAQFSSTQACTRRIHRSNTFGMLSSLHVGAEAKEFRKSHCLRDQETPADRHISTHSALSNIDTCVRVTTAKESRSHRVSTGMRTRCRWLRSLSLSLMFSQIARYSSRIRCI